MRRKLYKQLPAQVSKATGGEEKVKKKSGSRKALGWRSEEDAAPEAKPGTLQDLWKTGDICRSRPGHGKPLPPSRVRPGQSASYLLVLVL